MDTQHGCLLSEACRNGKPRVFITPTARKGIRYVAVGPEGTARPAGFATERFRDAVMDPLHITEKA